MQNNYKLFIISIYSVHLFFLELQLLLGIQSSSLYEVLKVTTNLGEVELIEWNNLLKAKLN